MTAKRVFLKAIMATRNGKRFWTGEYVCSGCSLQFRPDPIDNAKLPDDFARHVLERHTPARTEHEDFNQVDSKL